MRLTLTGIFGNEPVKSLAERSLRARVLVGHKIGESLTSMKVSEIALGIRWECIPGNDC